MHSLPLIRCLVYRCAFFLLFYGSGLSLCFAQQYNRGVGIYPGDPKETFSPLLKIDSSHYRNIALHRPAYQSSAYDYNLTAQLVTDGIIETSLPGWLIVTTSNGDTLKRDGREHLLDHHGSSQQNFEGSIGWYQVEMAGGYIPPDVDSFGVSGTVTIDTLQPPAHWEISVSGSDDGKSWVQIGDVSGDSLPGKDAMSDMAKRFSLDIKKMPPEQLAFFKRFAPPNRRLLQYSFKPETPVHYRYYRLTLNNPIAKRWSFGDMELFRGNHSAPIGGPYLFSSSWKSAGATEEWIYVDLGAVCSFDDIRLFWIRSAAAGTIQVSDNALDWKDIAPLPEKGENDMKMDIPVGKKIKARYVRILMKRPASLAEGYILSEIQVMGTGGPVPFAHAEQSPQKNGRKYLSGGAWKLERASGVSKGGIELSKPGFDDKDWLPATVPGTTLTSYLNDGAIADPNYGDNQFLVSDSYFYDDFWYRDVFTVPVSDKGKRVWLNFEGINWEAEVFLNGHELGRIDGAFIRSRFEISNLVIAGAKNVLAVKVIKNDEPGFPTEQNRVSTDANGGELGADNPTFHASIGWDWIPTIRGRNTGIWKDVFLSVSDAVTIENPLIYASLPLPDTTTANIHAEITLHNHDLKKVTGKLQVSIGNVMLEDPISLNDTETRTVLLDPKVYAALKIAHPRLWWPNGYGEQNLYDVRIRFVLDNGTISDVKSFKTGIREVSYTDSNSLLRIYVNGKRLVPFGGNWGFAEDMLRYRAREYDIAVRYHRDMHFTMIRNWVGQIGDEEFYDACDKYGIMVWQDFWLANPSDGPDPIHPEMFIANMEDFVKKIRNHPSIGIYVGRNEGNPPPILETALTSELPVLHPGIKYIPNSAFGSVSGGGPYGLTPLKAYFQNNRALSKLHSEMGMPDIVSAESFKQMMPDSSVWPQSSEWGLHDFTLQGAQRGENFNAAVEKAFGKTTDQKQWLSLAHWVEYQGYRAMFEAEAKNRMGLLLWMSHPAWPSLTWQTYDYYFEPTAAYFAAKKACEPLHIQWNPLTNDVEVVNYAAADGAKLEASMSVFDLSGKLLDKKDVSLDCPEDSIIRLFKPAKPAGVYLVNLQLKKGDQLISENSYIRGEQTDSAWGMGDLKTLLGLPKVKVNLKSSVTKQNDQWLITSELSNDSKYPAFNIRVKVIGKNNRKRLLPVIYSDNYFTLLPGERKKITATLKNADTGGEQPALVAEGLNVE
jgi:hypothetical protein